jgi:hypothetical protein
MATTTRVSAGALAKQREFKGGSWRMGGAQSCRNLQYYNNKIRALHNTLSALRSIGSEKGVRSMLIRKVRVPRTAELPNEGFLSRGDLPPSTAKRWVASRKAVVVKAVRFGLVSLEEACSLYDLTQDEYCSWQTAVGRYGETALRATALKKYRAIDQ